MTKCRSRIKLVGCVDDGDDSTKFYEFTFLGLNLRQLAIAGRLDLDIDLVGFDFQESFAFLHSGPFGFDPAQNPHLIALVARPQSRDRDIFLH